MFSRSIQRFSRLWIPLMAFAAGTLTCHAAGIDDLLEFRGYVRIGGEMQFSIYNKQAERSEWVSVNEAQDGYTVERFDSDTHSLVVRYSGGIGTLSLQASRIGRYIPELPESPPQPPSAEQLTQALTSSIPDLASRNQSGRPINASAPSTPADRTPSGGDATPSRISNTGRPVSPTVPPLPSPGGGPDDDGNDDDQDLDDDWESTGTPPPMPPTLPPTYSPED